MKTDEEEYGKNCPVCSTEWKKTPKFSSPGFFYECTKCEKSARDLMKQAAENKKTNNSRPSWYYGYDTISSHSKPVNPVSNSKKTDSEKFDEMLKELEEMMEEDDFGTFFTDYRSKSEWKL